MVYTVLKGCVQFYESKKSEKIFYTSYAAINPKYDIWQELFNFLQKQLFKSRAHIFFCLFLILKPKTFLWSNILKRKWAKQICLIYSSIKLPFVLRSNSFTVVVSVLSLYISTWALFLQIYASNTIGHQCQFA